jgi:hypothetical protein
MMDRLPMLVTHCSRASVHNQNIVLGHKSNPQAALHGARVLYFFPLSMVFTGDILAMLRALVPHTVVQAGCHLTTNVAPPPAQRNDDEGDVRVSRRAVVSGGGACGELSDRQFAHQFGSLRSSGLCSRECACLLAARDWAILAARHWSGWPQCHGWDAVWSGDGYFQSGVCVVFFQTEYVEPTTSLGGLHLPPGAPGGTAIGLLQL